MREELDDMLASLNDRWRSTAASWDDETGEAFGDNGIGSVAQLLQAGIDNDISFERRLEHLQGCLQSLEREIHIA